MVGDGSDLSPRGREPSARRSGPGSRTTFPTAGSRTASSSRPRSGRRSSSPGPTSCSRAAGSAPPGPTEYGGKGLSVIENVVLNEEFARAGAPMRGDFFGDTLVGPTILQWGTEEQKQEFLPQIMRGPDQLVPGLLRARRRLRPRRPEDHRGPRRRRVGDQRPEGVDHPGPDRRLRLPARPHRSRRPEAQGHQLPARADAASPASRCGRSCSPTGRRSSTRSSSPTSAAPQENVVGGVNNGWKVAMTTLGFERGSSATTSHRRFAKELDQILERAQANGRIADPTDPPAVSPASGAASRSSGSTACARCPTPCTAPSRRPPSGRSTR